MKLLCNFIEIVLRHGYSGVNLLHIFKTPFPKNTSRRLLLILVISYDNSFQLPFLFCSTVFMHWEFYLRVLPSAVIVLQLEKRSIIFIMTFANFSLKTRLTQLALTVVSFQNILKNILKNLFSDISSSSMARAIPCRNFCRQTVY